MVHLYICTTQSTTQCLQTFSKPHGTWIDKVDLYLMFYARSTANGHLEQNRVITVNFLPESETQCVVALVQFSARTSMLHALALVHRSGYPLKSY